MDRQAKKKILRSYQSLVIYLQKLQDDYTITYTNATRITPSMSGMPSSNVHENQIEKNAAKLADLKEKIEKAQAKKRRIERELAKLKKHQRYLIELIDIKGIPIPKAARMCGIAEKTARNNRNRIIDKMFLQKEK